MLGVVSTIPQRSTFSQCDGRSWNARSWSCWSSVSWTFQDQTVEKQLAAEQPAIHEKIIDDKEGVFGAYKAVSPEKKADLSEEEATALAAVEAAAPQATLKTTAIFPAIMLACYLLIIFILGQRWL